MTAFTKEQLAEIQVAAETEWGSNSWQSDHAAFALAQMERAEKAEGMIEVVRAVAGGRADTVEAERDEAAADATVLAHAYTTDSRPPQNIVDRSIRRGKDAPHRRRAKEASHGDD